MSKNYNTSLQANNTDLQEVLQILQNKAAGGVQATPVITVNSSNGLITATAGTKTSTHQLAFQPAKTITPTITSQIAVSSGYYTGGNITVAAVPTQTKTVTPKATSQNIVPDSGKFLTKVTVNGDSNLVAENIKSGVSIFGVNGTLEEGGGTSSGEQVEWSANEDARIAGTLSSYFNDRVTSIEKYAFYECTSLTSVNFPNVTTIKSFAFAYCSNLTSVNFSKVSSIERFAFAYCSKLTTVSFSNVITIGDNAFYECTSLTSVRFSNVITIEDHVFASCSKLTTVSFPNVTTIGIGIFYNCSKLTTVSFPNLTTIGSSTFNRCNSLISVNFPNATSVGSFAFCLCTNLTSVNFPNVTTIKNDAFANCSNLTLASFSKISSIGSDAFYYCTKLTKLYLTNSIACSLANSNAFQNAGITSTTGSIFVPASLVSAYKSATNWAYFSNRIFGI